MITRHTCVNDRRAKRIKLTEQSMKLINEVDGVIEKTRNEILGDITHDELNILYSLILQLELKYHS